MDIAIAWTVNTGTVLGELGTLLQPVNLLEEFSR